MQEQYFSPPTLIWSFFSGSPTYTAWNTRQNYQHLYPNPLFLPCAMEPDLSIINIIQFIRNDSQSHVCLFLLGNPSTFTRGIDLHSCSPSSHSPGKTPTGVVHPRSEHSSDGAHWDHHHLAWRTVSPVCGSFPGNVIHEFHFNTH